MGDQSPDTPADELLDRIEGTSDEIGDLLKGRRWKVWRKGWSRVPRDPEVRAMLARLFSLLGEAQRMIENSQTIQHRNELLRLMNAKLSGAKLDFVLEVVDGVDFVLIENGDASFLGKELDAEYLRAEEGETYRVSIDRLFGTDPGRLSEKLRTGDEPEDSDVAQARNWLRGLRHARSAHYRLQRARQRMKVRYLWSLSVLLAVLVPTMGYVVYRQGDVMPRHVILTCLSGALGAALSGTLKLREYVIQVNPLRLLQPGILVEPLLGAGFGLILFIVLHSELIIIGTPGREWPKLAVLAFLAGFSEPFTLNVLARVARATDITSAGRQR